MIKLLPILLATISAIPTAKDNFNSFTNFTIGTSSTGKVIGAISILLGLIITFFGFQLLDPVIGICGFIAFSDLTYFILVRSEPPSGYGDGRGLILLAVPIVVGILGALLAYSIVSLGLALVGFLGGASLAILILSFGTNGLIVSDWGRVVFIIVLGLVMAIAIQFAVRPIVIIATATTGSLAVFMGLDSFTNTGFNRITHLFLFRGIGVQGLSHRASTEVWYMILATFVLAIIGVGYQFKFGQYHKGVKSRHSRY
jgi:Domain of unknown function (DUF4203)